MSTAERAATRRLFTRQQALVSHDRWLVSYADFMTLLFAFFVVLFATTRHGPGAFGKLSGAIHSGFAGRTPGAVGTVGAIAPPAYSEPRPPASSPSNNPAVDQALNHVMDEAVNQEVDPAADPAAADDMDLLASQLQAALGGSIQKHEVSLLRTPEGLVISFQELGFFRSAEAALLPGQAGKIEEVGAILEAHRATLRIEGHSDDQPIHNRRFASNWELSAARAMRVLQLLVDESRYDPTRLSVAGYGSYRPVANNTTDAGRQRNRRVDLVVLRPRGQDPPAASR